MNFLDVKGIILPIEEGLETVRNLLSEKEVRRNHRLVRQMSRVDVRIVELMSILQRLKRAEKKEKGL